MKILIIHASAGAGHFKAAEALYRSISASVGHEAVLVDALDYSSPFFKKLYKGTYYFLISRMPQVWGFFFRLLDIGWVQPLVRVLRRIYNAVNVRGLHHYLMREQFDCIFMTHFMPTEIAAALKRSGRIAARLITVVTDFDVHKFWLAEGIDAYAVASGWTKEKLRQLGIAADKILVSGIPTDEKFSVPVDVGSLKRKLGLQEDAFTVLIATGSFGIGPIEEILRALPGFQAIVVCGHNRTLQDKLSAEKVPLVHVFGLVDNMHELMAAADVMVTKPGGLSIAEALVSQLPLIFFSAIPGQETDNIKVLKTYGIGVNGYNVQEIGKVLKDMKSSRDLFLSAIRKTKALARPAAVNDILSLIP